MKNRPLHVCVYIEYVPQVKEYIRLAKQGERIALKVAVEVVVAMMKYFSLYRNILYCVYICI